jgi:hypothetical protein
MQTSLTCLICVHLLLPAGAGLCQQQSCRLTFQSIPPALTCRVCRRPLALRAGRESAGGRPAGMPATRSSLGNREAGARPQQLCRIGVAHGLVRSQVLPSHSPLNTAPSAGIRAASRSLSGPSRPLIAQCESEAGRPRSDRTELLQFHRQLDAVSVRRINAGHCCQTGHSHSSRRPSIACRSIIPGLRRRRSGRCTRRDWVVRPSSNRVSTTESRGVCCRERSGPTSATPTTAEICGPFADRRWPILLPGRSWCGGGRAGISRRRLWVRRIRRSV